MEDDLRVRAEQVPEVSAVVRREWQAAHDAGRTAHDEPVWAEGLFTQVAVAWVLGTVFVRFSEDNGLLPNPLLAGPGERLRHAEEAQRAWFRTQPPERGDRDYVEDVFRQMAALPGIGHVFEAHNPVWQFGPSEDAARELLGLWREVDPESGDLRRDFTDPTWDTRFLGDLYEELSVSAQKTFALRQTPEFVEAFILDRTLDPAIDEFGLDGFKMIDPACGSGHFLLGSFDRLLARWRDRAPQDGDRALAERVLRSVHGIDLNPFAAAIARFRLLVAALRAAGIGTLAETPQFTLNIAVGDSLLHGPPPGQGAFEVVERSDPATSHLYETEDQGVIARLLADRYTAVVANPPYITTPDPALRSVYRRRFETCYKDFHLSTPFMELIFDLAHPVSGNAAGFFGVIQDDAFVKRPTGRPYVEKFLGKRVDLTGIVDTRGVKMPGHGTPTVMLFGRGRAPSGADVRAVMGIAGDPPDVVVSPTWRSILAAINQPGYSDEHVSSVDLKRSTLATHPWSLEGGQAAEVLRRVQGAQTSPLSGYITDIGTSLISRSDEAYESVTVSEPPRWSGSSRPYLRGPGIRDWSAEPQSRMIFPETRDGRPTPAVEKVLWPVRAPLRLRVAYGKKQEERGLPWFAYSMIFERRIGVPAIAYADINSHNQYAYVEQSGLGDRHAPVAVLSSGGVAAKEQILACLNASIGCFWLKQMSQKKTQAGGGGGAADSPFTHQYEFGQGVVSQFPVVQSSVDSWGGRLLELARELSADLPAAVVARSLPTRAALDAAHARVDGIRREMVAVQEELDWRCLFLYGVTDRDLSFEPGAVPAIDRGQRAFEIVLARKLAAREASSTWFERHGSTAITDVPTAWPSAYRERVEERMALIEADRNVGLVEWTDFKRRWDWKGWTSLEGEALRGWLLDRLEDPRYWPTTEPRSVAQLADTARVDAELLAVAEVYLGTIEVDLVALLTALVQAESVPYLAAWRYTDSGLRARAAWERTWDLQRAEDRGEDVGTIPVPPKYGREDFREEASWTLRGKLDVPKERFVSYPGLERDADPTLVVGWAGWDHLQQAQALAALYGQRQAVEGWQAVQLLPIIAGMAELVPWVHQWHNEPDPDGTRMGDFFTTFVASEAATNRFGEGDLASWRPPTKARGRRKASGA
jgi:hypothetical protein